QNTPAPPEPQSTPVPATTPAGQNIFVTVPSTFAAPSSYIGPTNINIVLLVVLGLIHLSVPYFYMGQTGKGVVFLILDFVFWPMMVASTCGMGSILYIPYKSILLTDALVVASRIKKGPIHPWRFF
ncbi:MAG: hypothetical protein R6V12_04310, partial [Candidatus Hydrogenedentota bacterium]